MPTNEPPENRPDADKSSGQISEGRPLSILGLPTNELAGLSVDEITGNKPAITMIMHYYKVLVDENLALKNDLNTARTYITGYSRRKTHSAIGGLLLTLSNVGVGFGINLLTSNVIWPGLATLLPGVALIIVGLYFTFRNGD